MIIKNKFIPLGNYKVLNFYGIILFTKSELSNKNINHELIHSILMLELGLVCSIIMLILIISFNLSPLWLILSISAFYIWYGLEYLIIRLFRIKDKQKNCYHDVSFEEEAYNNLSNLNYLNTRKLFSWTKYIKINTHE